MATLINQLLWVYVAALLVVVLWRYRRAVSLIVRLAEEQGRIAQATEVNSSARGLYVVILLPMLREQEKVQDLLKAIGHLDFPRDQMLVVPITTEREAAEQGIRRRVAKTMIEDLEAKRNGVRFRWKYSAHFSVERLRLWQKSYAIDPEGTRAAIEEFIELPTTRTIVDQVVAECAFHVPVRHLHYPGVDGNKATQMNYALNQLSDHLAAHDLRRTYIAVYDADSRPPRLSLRSLAMAVQKDAAPAFQQYPIYLSRGDSLGRMMRNEAWLQTARSVCVEHPRQLKVNAQLNSGRVSGKTYTYCIGHGEFLRADWLLRTRFPEEPPIDDVETGYMLSLAGLRIVPLPFFDFCEVPGNLLDFFRQTSVWFNGGTNYRSALQRARRHFGPVPIWRSLRGGIEHVVSNIVWVGSGPLRITLIVLCIVYGNWYTLAALLAVFAGEAISQWVVTRRLLDAHLDAASLPRFRFHWTAISRTVVQSIGPCLYVVRRLFGHAAVRYKTER